LVFLVWFLLKGKAARFAGHIEQIIHVAAFGGDFFGSG